MYGIQHINRSSGYTEMPTYGWQHRYFWEQSVIQNLLFSISFWFFVQPIVQAFFAIIFAVVVGISVVTIVDALLQHKGIDISIKKTWSGIPFGIEMSVKWLLYCFGKSALFGRFSIPYLFVGDDFPKVNPRLRKPNLVSGNYSFHPKRFF